MWNASMACFLYLTSPFFSSLTNGSLLPSSNLTPTLARRTPWLSSLHCCSSPCRCSAPPTANTLSSVRRMSFFFTFNPSSSLFSHEWILVFPVVDATTTAWRPTSRWWPTCCVSAKEPQQRGEESHGVHRARLAWGKRKAVIHSWEKTNREGLNINKTCRVGNATSAWNVYVADMDLRCII